MTAVRRIYVYVVAFAALGALGLGLANLARALVEVAVSTASATTPGYVPDQVALWGATALVGLPVWAVHWRWAQRLAVQAPERASALRRLFLYAVLAGATLAAWIALDESLRALGSALVGGSTSRARGVLPPLPIAAVAAVAWGYHWRAAARDRAAVGEAGGSATVRRWYVYGASLVGFVLLLMGAQLLVQSTWLLVTDLGGERAASVPGLAEATIGLGIWWLNGRWAPVALGAVGQAQDRGSTLRSVYLFLGLAVVVLGALAGVSQALYYGLARALGVAAPGGVGGSLLRAAAGPGSIALVYGLGWFYQRRLIARQARRVEAPQQVGVRRLYEYLTALVALALFALGVGGLLWLLGDALTRAVVAPSAGWWRDRASLFATLLVVGLPVWLLHWRPHHPADAQSLVRRIYLYLILAAGVLALLGSGAWAGYRLLSLVLGASAGAASAAELSHALAVALVAAGVGAYHWRAIRTDAELLGAAAPSPPARAAAVVEIEAPTAAALHEALASLAHRGVIVHRRVA